jgi:hypothetical protein
VGRNQQAFQSIGNPFKQVSKKSEAGFNYLETGISETERMGRTISGSMPPGLVTVKLDLSSQTMNDEELYPAIESVRSNTQKRRGVRNKKAKPQNFFSSEISHNRRLAPMKQEIFINANDSNYSNFHSPPKSP